MYQHIKELMYTVRIGIPDPRFGNMPLEQFGGANGELAAAMQYSIQGLNCDDPERRDLIMEWRSKYKKKEPISLLQKSVGFPTLASLDGLGWYAEPPQQAELRS